MKRAIKKANISGDITISEAFDMFIEFKQSKGLAQRTIDDYYETDMRIIKEMELTPEDSVRELTENAMIKYINHMRHQDVSDSYINHNIGTIRVFLYYCMENEWLEEYKIGKMKVQEEIPKYLTDDEIEAILDKPRPSDGFVEWRTYTICAVMLSTGARPATIADMKVSDIDFTRKEIKYSHVKTKKAMIVPMSAALEKALREYIRMWRNTSTGYLFPNIGDEKATVGSYHQAYARYCKKRGVNQSNIYALRHTFARGYILNGGNPLFLQKILGHTTLDMTRKYVKLFTGDLAVGIEDYAVFDITKKSKSRTQKIERK